MYVNPNAESDPFTSIMLHALTQPKPLRSCTICILYPPIADALLCINLVLVIYACQ